MRQLNEHHSFTGMQKDLSRSKHPTNFLYDAENIRLSTVGDSTLLAITNEKGPLNTGINVNGVYLGHCLVGKYLVVFSKGMYSDYITRIDLSAVDNYISAYNEYQQVIDGGGTAIEPTSPAVTLYSGNLKFRLDNKIEARGYYENEGIQKVYWTDGLNSPRMINIADNRITTSYTPFTADSFDFICKLQLNEQIIVNRNHTGEGMFNSGVIQYAFTYYNKYGQESNIFYTSPLLYISPAERGGAPDERVSNSFKIDVYNVDNNFDYLRIYSIQRTSLDGTPIVKRVRDLSIDSNTTKLTHVDNGTQGDTIDPAELLYKGGESIIAKTLEQKDNTLFFGNISIARKSIKSILKSLANSTALLTYIRSKITVVPSTNQERRFITINNGGSNTAQSYNYANQLESKQSHPTFTCGGSTYNLNKSTSCAGFKKGDVYRCGVQFQHETGVWSEPVFINDVEETCGSGITENPQTMSLRLATFIGSIDESLADSLIAEGYVRVRAVVVFPTLNDRNILCQGVACPTISHNGQNQSSWFFRPRTANVSDSSDILNILRIPASGDTDDQIPYTNDDVNDDDEYTFNPINLRSVEIQGDFTGNNRCTVNTNLLTLHSPEIEFDTDVQLFDWTNVTINKVGEAKFSSTVSDINIQTESPTIKGTANGFKQSDFKNWYSSGLRYSRGFLGKGIITGLFYEDWIVDDVGSSMIPLEAEKSPVRWFVYPWHRTGSLNNDIDRPSGQGTRSAVLKKKIISNSRYATTNWIDNSYSYSLGTNNNPAPQIFSSNELSILIVGGDVYQGNIDTILYPDKEDGYYYMMNNSSDVNGNTSREEEVTTTIDASKCYWKLHKKGSNNGKQSVFARIEDTTTFKWFEEADLIGNDVSQKLVSDKGMVRMKYKSTPHMVMIDNPTSANSILNLQSTGSNICALPIVEITHSVNTSTRFGGNSEDALKSNLWIPCGEPVRLDSTPVNGAIKFEYSYGDSYIQRWDCLKTYAFTEEDINQIVEIGSFQLESHINLDGRYDKNRGMTSNLHMSPRNFNLMNLVYSQINNFFTYRILDDDYYNLNDYPNQITWSKEKQAGADIDAWTNITLASTYNLDGTKGEIRALRAWQDKLFCFQDKGVSLILFNSRVQIPTSDGIPIEISNNYKVDGYKYLSDGIGCINKWAIKETPSGVYFIDSGSNHLYHIADGLQDVAITKNMASWFQDNKVNRLLYDCVHKDLYVSYEIDSNTKLLCFSEVLGQFTSFFSYYGTSFIESYQDSVFIVNSRGNIAADIGINKMFEGEYNKFFGDNFFDWYIDFISNGFDTNTIDFDKIFSTIDYRMDLKDDHKGTFSTIQVDNEYQTTSEVDLVSFTNPTIPNRNTQKKFRTWRIQIPRARKKNSSNQWIATNDRIRNQWCEIKLRCDAYRLVDGDAVSTGPAILHDLNVQFFV